MRFVRDLQRPPRVRLAFRAWRTAWLVLLGLSCARPPISGPLEFGDGRATTIPGLAACSPQQAALREIDPDEPLLVLVHGCYSSGGRFRSLADVFELHGQQTLCFNYDYRDSLRQSGDELRVAIRALHRHMDHDQLTIVGHSQGGLVARAALSQGGNEPLEADLEGRVRLVTVSSPFAGIRAASDCGSLPMHIASLGITVAACQIATGSNWNEIHPKAEMVRDPAPLQPAVESHLVVMTEERNSCRRYGPTGACEESDFVFAIEEQDNPLLLDDGRVRRDRVEAGHVEIVGGSGRHPQGLIEVLQDHGILRQTPAELREELAQLLIRLF